MIKIDASSFIYSIKMDWINVLKELYEDLIITSSVHKEVILNGKNRGKPDAFIGEKLIKKYDIQIHDIEKNSEVEIGLGEGETDTILNTIELKCSCLIDDKKAIRIAESFDLQVFSIPISLLDAYKRQKIDDKKFEMFFQKWIIAASPSYEDIFLIKKSKELMSE
jgi:predicted nucleic acid-binding protein